MLQDGFFEREQLGKIDLIHGDMRRQVHPERPRVQPRAEQHDLIDVCRKCLADTVIDQPNANAAAFEESVRQCLQLCPTLWCKARARRVDESLRKRIVIQAVGSIAFASSDHCHTDCSHRDTVDGYVRYVYRHFLASLSSL